jgi:hypothetical protein
MDFIPNTFQTPNAIVDKLMFLLTDSEFRVLMYMVRHILGWQRKADMRRACISLSNFEDGFSYDTPEGEVSYPGCGVGKNPIRNALKELQKYRIVEAIGEPKAIGQEWELRFMTKDDVDIVGLQLRQDTNQRSRKKQTENARKVSPKNTGVSVQQIEQEGICSTDIDPICSTDSQGICSTDNNETHRKHHGKDQTTKGVVVGKPVKEPPVDTGFGRIVIVVEQLEQMHRDLANAIKDWLKEYSEAEIVKAVAIAVENRRNGTKIYSVAKYLPGILTKQRLEAQQKQTEPPRVIQYVTAPLPPDPIEQQRAADYLAQNKPNFKPTGRGLEYHPDMKAAGE